MVFELISDRARGHLPARFRRMVQLYLMIEERNESIASLIAEKGWEELPEYKQLLQNMDRLEEKLRELEEIVAPKVSINIVKIPITIYVAGLTTGEPRLLCARTNTTIEVPEVTEGVAWTSEAVFKSREVLNKILKDIWVQTALWDNIDDPYYPTASDLKSLKASADEISGCDYMARIRSIPADIQDMFNLDEIAEKNGYERIEDKYILR